MNKVSFAGIIVSGVDAERFLQGQFTCDMTKVDQNPSFGAYCDAKGRMLANFWIAKANEAYQIGLPELMCSVVLDTLKKYGAFSKVDIFQQPIDETIFDVDRGRLDYINKGIAFIFPETSLLFTPQMISWERHGGVSFEKGCYLGQEIVARTQHLGKLKRHLHKFECVGDVDIKPGDKLLNQHDGVVGIVCDAAVSGGQVIGLAVIQDQACDEILLFDGVEVSI